MLERGVVKENSVSNGVKPMPPLNSGTRNLTKFWPVTSCPRDPLQNYVDKFPTCNSTVWRLPGYMVPRTNILGRPLEMSLLSAIRNSQIPHRSAGAFHATATAMTTSYRLPFSQHEYLESIIQHLESTNPRYRRVVRSLLLPLPFKA